MNADQRDLMEGLGLCLLALLFGGLFMYGAVVVGLAGKYPRAAIYAGVGLLGLFWGVRLTRTELSRYRESRRG